MESLTQYLDDFTYVGVSVWLLLAGLGLPLPEDVPLIFGGVMAARGEINVVAHFFISMVFIIIGDSCLFFIGQRIGRATEVSPRWSKYITPDRREKVHGFFVKYGLWTVFFGRFVAGIRGAIFVSAGVAGFDYPRFVLMDFLAALVSVPVWIYLGWVTGANWEQIVDTAKEYQLAVVIGAAALTAVGFWIANQRKKRKNAAG